MFDILSGCQIVLPSFTFVFSLREMKLGQRRTRRIWRVKHMLLFEKKTIRHLLRRLWVYF